MAKISGDGSRVEKNRDTNTNSRIENRTSTEHLTLIHPTKEPEAAEEESHRKADLFLVTNHER